MPQHDADITTHHHPAAADSPGEEDDKSRYRSGKAAGATADDKPHTDPVCGMKAATNPEKSAVVDDVTYYFCSMRCVEKFKLDPARYLHPEQQAASIEVVPAGAMYTCPMHPEIRQDRPGSCPKCGMALEPEMPTLDEGEDHELVDFQRRFL